MLLGLHVRAECDRWQPAIGDHGAGDAGRGAQRADGAGGPIVTGLRSGQAADAAGVNRETLRYYERVGLLERPERTLGGHRLYPQETVTVIR